MKQKYNFINGGCIPTFYNNANELIDFLELIIESIAAGTDNNNIKKYGMAINDELLKVGANSKDEHEILYNQNFI